MFESLLDIAEAAIDMGTNAAGESKKTKSLRLALKGALAAVKITRNMVSANKSIETIFDRASAIQEKDPRADASAILSDPTVIVEIVNLFVSAADSASVAMNFKSDMSKAKLLEAPLEGRKELRQKALEDVKMAQRYAVAPAGLKIAQSLPEVAKTAQETAERATQLYEDPKTTLGTYLTDPVLTQNRQALKKSIGETWKQTKEFTEAHEKVYGKHSVVEPETKKGFLGKAKDTTGEVFKQGIEAWHTREWMRAAEGKKETKPEETAQKIDRFVQSVKQRGRESLEAMLPNRMPNDGDLTGPFYPANWKGARLSPEEAEKAITRGATVFINGIDTALPAHIHAAKRLANTLTTPVVGVFNATGGNKGWDLLQSVSDKAHDAGRVIGRGNLAVKTMVNLFEKHGKGMKIIAHSQGSLIVSEALRQVQSDGVDISKHDVTTLGNAAYTFPKGAHYHHYVHDDDLVPTFAGTTSGGFSRDPNASVTLLHHGGSGIHPHDLDDPSQHDYIGDLPKFRAAEKQQTAAGKRLPGMRETLPRVLGNTGRALGKGGAEAAGDYGISATNRIGKAGASASNWVSKHYNSLNQRMRAMPSASDFLPKPRQLAHAMGTAGSAVSGAVESRYNGISGMAKSVLPGAIFNPLDTGFRAAGRTIQSAGSTVNKTIGSVPAVKPNQFLNLADRGIRGVGNSALDAGSWMKQRATGLFEGWGGKATPTATPATTVQKKSSGAGAGSGANVDAGSLRNDLLKRSGSGFSPSGNIRKELGGHLGFDPAGARLHTGPEAAAAARNLHAEAFTIGNDVFFGEGRYNPASREGMGLLAHELTHVGQQTGTTGDKARFFSERGGDEMEGEAQETGQRVFANLGSRSGLRVENFAPEYAVEGGGSVSKSDQERLDGIAQLALREAEKRVSALGVAQIPLAVVNVDVTLDLDSMSDAEAADAWAEAIISRITPPGITANLITPIEHARLGIQRYEAGEHAQFGAMIGQTERVFNLNGHPITYGEMIAMGDFFESPEQMNQASPDEIGKLLVLIRADRQAFEAKSAGHPTTANWQEATAKRYVELAAKNDAHFSPDNWQTFVEYFKQAFNLAIMGNLDRALQTVAFGGHFLTDAFSAGHLFNKQKVLAKADKRVGPKFYKELAAEVYRLNKTKLDNYEVNTAMFASWKEMNEENLAAAFDRAHLWKKEKFNSAFVRVIHDQLNNDMQPEGGGIPVYNKRGDGTEAGDPWKLSGDGTLNLSSKTLQIAREAVALSQTYIEQIHAARLDSVRTAKMLTQGIREISDTLPIPDKEGQQKIDGAIDTYSDPNNPKTVNAIADLLTREIDQILAELSANDTLLGIHKNLLRLKGDAYGRMDIKEKLGHAIALALPKMPGSIATEIKNQLPLLIVGIIAAVGAQFIPGVNVVVDALGYIMLGAMAFQLLKETAEFFSAVNDARNEADMNAAAGLFAHLASEALIALLLAVAMKKLKIKKEGKGGGEGGEGKRKFEGQPAEEGAPIPPDENVRFPSPNSKQGNSNEGSKGGEIEKPEATATVARKTFKEIYSQDLQAGLVPEPGNGAILPDLKRYPTVRIMPNGDVIGDYSHVRKFAKECGLTSGRRIGESSIEVHHLLEERLIKFFGISRGKGLSVTLEASDHAEFSAEVPRHLPRKVFFDIDDVYDAHAQVYDEAGHPEWNAEIRKFLQSQKQTIKKAYESGKVPGANLPDFPQRKQRAFSFLDSL